MRLLKIYIKYIFHYKYSCKHIVHKSQIETICYNCIAVQLQCNYKTCYNMKIFTLTMHTLQFSSVHRVRSIPCCENI